MGHGAEVGLADDPPQGRQPELRVPRCLRNLVDEPTDQRAAGDCESDCGSGAGGAYDDHNRESPATGRPRYPPAGRLARGPPEAEAGCSSNHETIDEASCGQELQAEKAVEQIGRAHV